MNQEVIDEKTKKMHEVLKRTAAKTLERKRRLGHYAVLWKDGKVVLEGEDAPTVLLSGDSLKKR